MSLAYIGLGSNLSDPQAQIISALTMLEQLKNCSVTNVSSLYYSRPMGPQDQPDYMNAVVAIATSLTPIELLDQLQSIEKKAGRVRKGNRWGARVLDLDILLFDNLIIDTERLIVPHYGLKLREFVLLPLNEIAPTLLLPDGASIHQLANQIEKNGLKIHSQLR